MSDYNLNISMMREHLSDYSQIGIGNDFCMLDIRPGVSGTYLGHPYRLDGIMMLYCMKGGIRLDINLKEYEIRKNSLMFCAPGNLLKVTGFDESEKEDFHFVLVAMSQEFASELRADFKKFLNDGVSLIDSPVIQLPAESEDVLGDYLLLISKVVLSDMTLKDTALRSLMSSMLSFAAGLWMDSLNEIKKNSAPVTGRNRIVFEQFLKLVSENYMKYRNVGYYADILCLTPKYLSKLIKAYSGKSAPEWIDSYVILEAKNLLKYSDLAIKEIVYRLNFPNQSVFYKFFKARTGMTPSQYRNS